VPATSEPVAARWQAAFAAHDVATLSSLLDENVRWGGAEDTPQTCHTRSEVLARLAQQAAHGTTARVVEVVADAFLVELHVTHPETPAYQRSRTVYQVLTVADGRVTNIRGYPSRAEAAAAAGVELDPDHALPQIQARQLVPILSVSSLAASFEWFAHLGWAKAWAWGSTGAEPTFGAIESGDFSIFLSQNAQGAPGMWLSLWVDDVDQVHTACQRHGLDVIRPPQNEPWHVREMHVRHPDGHVLRISQGIHTH
jgi:ketosteroid isomerase-like protein